MLNLAIAALALVIVAVTRIWLRSRIPRYTGGTDAYTKVKLERLRAATSAAPHAETAPPPHAARADS